MNTSCATALGLILAATSVAASAQPTVARTPEEVWRAECASCHMAYPPGLLPERSWRRLMSGLDRHFGQDASLGGPALQMVTEYLVANSAERSTHRRASRFLRSIPSDATPLRITENAYFRREHDEVAPEVWKRPKVGGPSNCIACHGDAEQGDFSERNIRIPR
jgi:hypothetical protein